MMRISVSRARPGADLCAKALQSAWRSMHSAVEPPRMNATTSAHVVDPYDPVKHNAPKPPLWQPLDRLSRWRYMLRHNSANTYALKRVQRRYSEFTTAKFAPAAEVRMPCFFAAPRLMQGVQALFRKAHDSFATGDRTTLASILSDGLYAVRDAALASVRRGSLTAQWALLDRRRMQSGC